MSTGIRKVLGAPRRALGGFALLVALASGIVVWQLGGGSAAASVPASAVATRGNIVVAVGGVGRIVEQGAPAQLVASALAASSAAGSSGSSSTPTVTTAPAGAVFPRTSGRVVRLLVAPGQAVSAGQPIAILSDGGVTAGALEQARYDEATAELELRQKQTSDPAKGLPATPEELAAGQYAVTAAKQRLARLLGPVRPVDVQAAQLEVKRADAELAVLLGGSAADRAEAMKLAELAVQVAEKQLARILAPPNPADVAAALADVKRAEADLATLERPAITPAPEALDAARKSVAEARQALARAMQSGDRDVIRDAQAQLDQALAELDLLLKPGPAALPVQIEAAQAALEAAQAKLARLSEPPNAADVLTAQLELERARAELQRLKAGPTPAALAAARLSVASARARLAQVLGPPLATDVAAARLDVRKSEADLAVLHSRGGPASPTDLELAQLKVETTQAKLVAARTAQRQLTVRSLTAGTVTELLTAVGAPVDAVTPIATVVDLGHLTAIVPLSEFDVAQVKRGLRASVRVDALGGKAFRGTVAFTALSGTDTGGIVTFPVEVSLAGGGSLKPGMSVSVRIIVAQRRGVVQVPLEAVTRDDEDRPVVTLLTAADERVSRRVALGLSNNKQVEIVRGLRAGDRVVLPESQDQGGEGD